MLGQGSNRLTARDITKITEIINGESLEKLGLNLQQAVLLLSAGKTVLNEGNMKLPENIKAKYDETLQMYKEGLQLIDEYK